MQDRSSGLKWPYSSRNYPELAPVIWIQSKPAPYILNCLAAALYIWKTILINRNSINFRPPFETVCKLMGQIEITAFCEIHLLDFAAALRFRRKNHCFENCLSLSSSNTAPFSISSPPSTQEKEKLLTAIPGSRMCVILLHGNYKNLNLMQIKAAIQLKMRSPSSVIYRTVCENFCTLTIFAPGLIIRYGF